MGRIIDELVFREVPNIPPKYTRSGSCLISDFSIQSIENFSIRLEVGFGAAIRRDQSPVFSAPEKSILSIEILNCTFRYPKHY
jgi:hypothetical protein